MASIVLWGNHLINSDNFLLSDCKIVFTYHDLKSSVLISDFTCIIILCEVNNPDDNQQLKNYDLQGIDLAKELRRDGIKTPIIFTSFLSKKQVYNNKLDRSIINTIGHGFVRLPFMQERFDTVMANLNELNELELYDIVHNYCNLAGIVKMLLHSLNGLQSVTLITDNEKKDIRKKISAAITQVHELFRQDSSLVISEFDTLFKDLTAENLNEAIRFVENIGIELVESFAPTKNGRTLIKAVGGWSMLLLDDEITLSHPFVQRLKERNINVLCAKNADAANLYLGSDTKIVLVLSDYRLETEEDGLMIHQGIQGYQFLKQLSDERPGYLRLAALSSLPRKFLMQSFRHFGIRVEIFSKKDYLENASTLEILCDELVDLGNENNEAIVRLPRITSETWEVFEPYYRHHRNSINYMSGENYISQRSREYCEGILKNEYTFNLDGYTALNFDAKKAKITGVNDETGNEPSINQKYYKIFLEKCICRRVAIWYTQNNTDWQLKDVLKVIKGNNYTGEEKETTAKNQINYNLALSLAEYPWNMTLEEKQWLVFQMAIKDIELIEKQEAALLMQCFESIERWTGNHFLENDLVVNPAFIPFFRDGQARYGANFKIFKSFLHQLYLYIINKDDLIKSLQRDLILLIEQISKTGQSANSILFKAYLEFYRKQLMATKSLDKGAKISIGSSEAFFTEIVGRVIPKIPENQRDEFKGTAAIFYWDNLENQFTSTKHWEDALMEAHYDNIRKWSSFGVMEYDERKSLKKHKNNYADDF